MNCAVWHCHVKCQCFYLADQIWFRLKFLTIDLRSGWKYGCGMCTECIWNAWTNFRNEFPTSKHGMKLYEYKSANIFRGITLTLVWPEDFFNVWGKLKTIVCSAWPPLWSGGQSFWLQIHSSRVRFPALPDFLSSSWSGTGSTQSREVNWGATWIKRSCGSRSRKQINGRGDPLRWPRDNPLSAKVGTTPTGGGRSVGIVRSQTKATEISVFSYDWKWTDISPTYLRYLSDHLQPSRDLRKGAAVHDQTWPCVNWYRWRIF
jgi:hypothetical protein